MRERTHMEAIAAALPLFAPEPASRIITFAGAAPLASTSTVPPVLPLTAAEALSKAMEALIGDLTREAWEVATTESNRRCLQRVDVTRAILRNPVKYAFFLDLLPDEDLPAPALLASLRHMKPEPSLLDHPAPRAADAPLPPAHPQAPA